MFMADPKCFENIVRVEEKYPRRDNSLSPNIEWISNKLKLLIHSIFGDKLLSLLGLSLIHI